MPGKGSPQVSEPKLALVAQHNHDDTLPGYSENPRAAGSPTSTWSQQVLATPGLPNVDILAYLPSNATLSSDHATVTIRDTHLATVPVALASFVAAQAALPPRPVLRIAGSSNGNTEFDLKIDMMRYLVPKRDGPSWNYVKIADTNEAVRGGKSSKSVEPQCNTLLELAQRFIESSAGNKSFVLKREFLNWNTQLLEGRIRTLIAWLVEKDEIADIDDIEISFLATHTRVVVLPPQTGVIHQFLSILSPTKEFAVVRTVWPYANTDKEQLEGIPRQCVVQSEDDWWQVWRPIIAMGMMSGKSGWLGTEDVMDMAMCPRKSVTRHFLANRC